MADDDKGGMAGSGPMPEPDARTPFERFEDLTRKLVRVPKSEIDEKRRASKAD
jgi:hypothetical protein